MTRRRRWQWGTRRRKQISKRTWPSSSIAKRSRSPRNFSSRKDRPPQNWSTSRAAKWWTWFMKSSASSLRWTPKVLPLGRLHSALSSRHQTNERNYITEDEVPIMPYPSQPPPPGLPLISKMDIYNDPNVFAELDQIAINVSLLFCSLISFFSYIVWQIGRSRRPENIHRFGATSHRKLHYWCGKSQSHLQMDYRQELEHN